ncbi:enoyl-CoA hydratase/isomerase family protein [Williamsia sp.]|uniref:enoyl-CoA hydratase/isomerase family protein n=1 Tax=Williamsia sp. TaxID=1872085 RepID=UPI0039C933E9
MSELPGGPAEQALTLVDLADAGAVRFDTPIPGCLIAVDSNGGPLSDEAERIVGRATFALTQAPARDRRFITVDSIPDAVDELRQRVADRPVSAAICDDVLRAGDSNTDTFGGLMTESLAYSTLQAGREFRNWLAEQGPRRLADPPQPVILERNGGVVVITLNQPKRHNAFSNTLRAGLIDGLTIALHDPSVTGVEFRGNGKSFCSGGDLTEFGTFHDPAASHLARTRYSPALLLNAVHDRLGENLKAFTHGATMGSGLEMAAACGHVTAHPDTVFGLPELTLGLIPGAGGTVSIPRRIGRWRTAYLVLSGKTIDATTALGWGLIDEISS